MKKKLVNIILLLIVLISLLSFSSNAAIGDGFRGAFNSIEDFFSGGWQNYEKTVTFIVFFFLFFSAFLIGAKKAFKELTRSHIVFTVVAAFLSAMIISTTISFDWINLEYVAWFLIGVLVLFLIHSLLLKLGMEKYKFWAFILALLIAALLLGLIWYLMSEGRPLEGFGRVSNWFEDLGEEEEAKSELWPEGPPLKEGEERPPERRGRTWLWVLIILIPVLFGGGSILWWKKRGNELWRGRKDRHTKKVESTLKVLLDLLGKLINIQKLIMKGFKEKTKHSILTEEMDRKYEFPDPDIAWFKTKKNKEYTKKILKNIKKLFDDNKKLMEKLNEGLRLDVKEMDVLKHLALELQKEIQVKETVEKYYKGNKTYIGNYLELAKAGKIKNQYSRRKPYRPLTERKHYKPFKIRKELKGEITSQIIVEEREMEKYLRQMLAPVLLRLYQLFKEFEEVIGKEQRLALTPLNNITTKALEEQKGEIKLEKNIKEELDSHIHKFVTFVKDKEWIIYKNLEKDHDDKAEAKKDLEREIWKIKGATKNVEASQSMPT